ncbi:MAG: hypothetical protein CM1200mP2_52100 [Planctomycetaceae bacterium]|nr:hypothetical protein [Planctomycetales bacterium]GIS62985.1 MAG: hypothetical protein CM1200mP2_52100 [Planctomycetaceae bacterium]
MNTFDFHRSFFTFRIDTLVKQPLTVTHKPPFSLNNARIPIECRCVVTEKATDQSQAFVLGASCKTERVGVEGDIWLEPNADFCPIFSDDRYLSLKTYSQVGTTMELFPPGSGSQSDRQTGLIDETYDSVKIDMTECEGTPLDSAQEIVEAVLANQNLVARTELENDRYHALIEHPVKTINANERDWIYQTDTGPVLFPDLSVEPDAMLTSLELAYSAFNCPDWIEFIVRRVTPTTSDVSVYHYSDAVRCDSRNQMLRIG